MPGSLLNDLLVLPDQLITSLSIGVPQTMPFLYGAYLPTPAYGPSTAGPGQTPTVSQFLNAANAEYALGAAPVGLRPFIINGQQLSATNTLDGLAARVWITGTNQVIVAYSGTTNGDNLLLNPAILTPEIIADSSFLQGKTPAAAIDAAHFAKQVTQAAAQQGISAQNVFVTGHSLGADLAQYAAQQTGLGGIGFEGSGIAKSATAVGNGGNFASVVTYGDPFASYASDVQGEQPYAPAYAPGQAGALPHYGQVIMVGDPAAVSGLETKPALPTNTPAGATTDLLVNIAANPNFVEYHLPETQAHDLGVTLSPNSILFGALSSAVSNVSGPVFPAASDTVPQFLAAYNATHMIAAPVT
ncbi:MAG: hypothetical protein B7Z78_04710 [Rhodospirillales bacterium 20-60-12]|nr:MAG: hypothetical protein B7Z78_04710 [Rhodospirillales bacterium 20-60-12]